VLAFPPDITCLGALRTPFRPPAPPPLAPPQRNAFRRPVQHWAPQYLLNAASDMKLVRMADGLLILGLTSRVEVARSIFVPIAKGVRIAGLRLYREALTLIVHAEPDGTQVLALGIYHLPADGGGRRTFRRQVRAQTSQLFRQQPDYTLPSFTQIGGARFYSTSGRPFQIAFDQAGELASFHPLYKGPRIIGVSGGHDIVRTEGSARCRIDVLRASGHEICSFDEGEVPLLSPKLLGLRYTHSAGSLAYSVTPNCWKFARPWNAQEAYQVDETPVILKPWETLLTGAARPRDVLARVWSDARYGGEGEIRNLRLVEGETTIRQPVLRLGDDAASIVAVEISDDGHVWAVAVDNSGEPEFLYAYRKVGSRLERTAISLEDHRAAASVVELDGLFG
jgi:hypothetical protein